METIEIGTTTITYLQNGKVDQVTFEPAKMKASAELIKQLEAIQGGNDVQIVKNNAQMVVAAYFTRMNDIELSDRQEWEIASEVVNCEKYDNDQVKVCSQKFIWRKIKQFSEN